MKKLFSTAFYSWLFVALCFALFSCLINAGRVGLSVHVDQGFDVAWFGVLLAALAPLLNKLWVYDNDDSINTNVRLPKVSLLVMMGVAWVLLTISDRGWPLWFVLGILGGFLLNTYWATLVDER